MRYGDKTLFTKFVRDLGMMFIVMAVASLIGLVILAFLDI